MHVSLPRFFRVTRQHRPCHRSPTPAEVPGRNRTFETSLRRPTPKPCHHRLRSVPKRRFLASYCTAPLCHRSIWGPLTAMKCPSSEPVSTMVPTPLFSVVLDRMSSPDCPARGWRWPAGSSVDRPCCSNSCVRTCCPPETKLGPSMWSMLKGSRSFRMRRLPL